jgi:chaperonin GroES
MKKNRSRRKMMTFPVKPLYDQVFVKKDDESKTKSGLHLTQSVKGRAVIGTVVAVGPGLLSPYSGNFLPMSVEEGDRVFLREFTGYIIKYEDEEVHVFKENEIIGVIPGE